MSAHDPICATCGVQYDKPSFDPDACRICLDERQYVGWQGQRWTSIDQLADEGRRGVVRPEEPGLWGVGTEPSFAIGQRALLVPGEGGNLLWDCVSFVDDDTVRAVEAKGGIAAIAISHPHFYGAMIEWSEAFGGVPVYIHEADREWVCRQGNVEFWTGDTLEVLPGRTLINGGVHFAGGTVAHFTDPATGEGSLCSGDIFTVVMDRMHVGFMYSYPNLIPEHPGTIRRALALMEPFEVVNIYGAWWGRVVRGRGKEALRRSADRYLRHIGLA
jgi:hypothetical protein